jgi:hypothetical protein
MFNARMHDAARGAPFDVMFQFKRGQVAVECSLNGSSVLDEFTHKNVISFKKL